MMVSLLILSLFGGFEYVIDSTCFAGMSHDDIEDFRQDVVNSLIEFEASISMLSFLSNDDSYRQSCQALKELKECQRYEQGNLKFEFLESLQSFYSERADSKLSCEDTSLRFPS